MKTNNLSLLLILLLGPVAYTMGQQLPQFSQYMHNTYLINPAAAGMYNHSDIVLGGRQQWAGFEGAPQSVYASGHTFLGQSETPSQARYSVPVSKPELHKALQGPRKVKHGLGAIVAHDEYGAFKRNSVSVGYALHLPVKEKNYFSVGLSTGWSGIQFNTGSITLENPQDNTYFDFIALGNNANIIDFNIGAMYYGEKFFVGYSAYQMFRNQISLGNAVTPENLSDARLNFHHFLLGSYRFDLSEDFALIPSTLVKFMEPAPPAVDINLKAELYNQFWLGFSYRHTDAVAILAGLVISDRLRVGYSYDYTVSALNNYQTGSHEVVLGLMLPKKSK